MSIYDFGADLWIELIIVNDLSNQDVFNLCLTCQQLSQLLKNEKLVQFLQVRTIHFGNYINEEQNSYFSPISVAWSPDNRSIASGDSIGKIHIWNTCTGLKKATVSNENNGSACCLAFHPQKANLLAVGYDRKTLCLYDIESCETKLKITKDTSNGIRCIAFHPQGQYLVSGNIEGTIRIWNVENGKCEKEHPSSFAKSRVFNVAFSSNGQFLGASTKDLIFVLNFETFECVHTLFLNRFHVTKSAFQFFDDNKTLVCANSASSPIQFYDILNGKQNDQMNFDSNKRTHCFLALHPNQKIMVLAGTDQFEIWDLQKKKLLEKKKDIALITDMTLSPNGKALALALGKQNHIQVLDVRKYL